LPLQKFDDSVSFGCHIGRNNYGRTSIAYRQRRMLTNEAFGIGTTTVARELIAPATR
jgi:hypothetical protein